MITLASKSKARAAVLRGAGVAFEIAGSGVDEAAAKAGLAATGAGPRQVAEALAAQKALAVSKARPGLVIGADQTLDLGGELHDKAETLAEAREKLVRLRGRAHQLHSAVAVARGGEIVWHETPAATLVMRPFSDAFLDAYLERQGEAILSCVGCYRLEDEGVQLFSAIEGDYFTILGLPLMGLLDLLRREGALGA